MQVRGRTLRFTVVLAIVMLTLTGFSRGHSHGHSRHSGGGGGGGGGCSSSHQDHDSSSSSTSGGGSSSSTSGGGPSYDDSADDTYGSGGTTGGYYNRRPTHRATSTPSGGSGTRLEDGEATLISCATAAEPYATVEVANPNNRKAGFEVRVTFYDAEGGLLTDKSSLAASVPAHGKATTRVPLAKNFLSSVDHCQVDGQAEAEVKS